MDNLWRKEKDSVEPLYVNLLESVNVQFVNETKEWDEYLQTLK